MLFSRRFCDFLAIVFSVFVNIFSVLVENDLLGSSVGKLGSEIVIWEILQRNSTSASEQSSCSKAATRN